MYEIWHYTKSQTHSVHTGNLHTNVTPSENELKVTRTTQNRASIALLYIHGKHFIGGKSKQTFIRETLKPYVIYQNHYFTGNEIGGPG